jgi:hypothetical protein
MAKSLVVKSLLCIFRVNVENIQEFEAFTTVLTLFATCREVIPDS